MSIDVPTVTTAAEVSDPGLSAAPASAPTDKILVFIAYRRLDGEACAKAVQDALHDQPVSTAEGRVAKLDTYFDVHAPAISDWRDKWKTDLAVCRAFILVCSPLAAREQIIGYTPDWLYEEIRWWTTHRKTAPILIDAWPAGECHVPEPIATVWPYAQRVSWSPDMTEADMRLLRQRIVEGLVLSARGIDHEELRRLRVRNRVLGTLAIAVLALAVGLFVAFQREASARADAERNLHAFYGPALRTVQQLIEEENISTAIARLDAIPERLRGWEWRHLRGLADESVAFWSDNTTVNRVAYTPSGAILSGDYDGFVRIHDPKTLAVVREANVHGKIVTGMVQVDATHIVSAGYDNALREWDVASGAVRVIATFDVGHVPLIADYRHGLLVSAGHDQGIRVFTLAAGAETLLAGSVFPWQVVSVAISPDGETVAVLGVHEIALYAWRSRTVTRSEKRSGDVPLRQVSYSADGARLLLLDDAHKPAVVSAETLADLPGGLAGFNVEPSELQVLAAHDGQVAFSGIASSTILVSWPYERTLRGHLRDVHWQVFSPDGRRLVSAGEDGVRLWEVDRQPPVLKLPGGAGAIAASSDGRWAVGVPDTVLPPRLRIWNLQTGVERQYDAPGATCVAFYPDSKRFVVGFRSGQIGVYEVDSVKLLESRAFRPDLKPDRDAIMSVAVSHDGTQLAAAGLYFAAVWNSTSTDLWLIPHGNRSVSFASSGRLAVGYNADAPRSLFRIWVPLEGGPRVESEKTGSDVANSLAVSADGRLVLATHLPQVSLWNAANGTKVRVITNEPNRGTFRAVFSPDGQRILMSGAKPVIWDVDGNELLEFGVPGSDVAWAGDRLLSANADGLTIYSAPH